MVFVGWLFGAFQSVAMSVFTVFQLAVFAFWFGPHILAILAFIFNDIAIALYESLGLVVDDSLVFLGSMALDINDILLTADVSDHGFYASDSDFIWLIMTPGPAVPECTYIGRDRHLFRAWLSGGRKVYAALAYCLSAMHCLLLSPQQGLLLLLTIVFLHLCPEAYVCTHVSYSSILVSVPLFFCSESSVEFVPARLQWRDR